MKNGQNEIGTDVRNEKYRRNKKKGVARKKEKVEQSKNKLYVEKC
jgi:hypothetical protein